MKELKFIRSCFACPEQYDVLDENNNQVGYLRLRHGAFSVEQPDCGGEIIYEANPKGDGMFDEEERGFYLEKAREAILKALEE